MRDTLPIAGLACAAVVSTLGLVLFLDWRRRRK